MKSILMASLFSLREEMQKQYGILFKVDYAQLGTFSIYNAGMLFQ